MTSTPTRPRSIAYLVSQYPMLSMIFIIREVLELRRLGWEVDVASINSSDRALTGLTAVEAAEAERTFYVKEQGVAGAVTAHLRTLVTSPRGWLRGARRTLGQLAFGPRQFALHAVYFTEAVMVGRWMRRHGHSHLHVHLGSQAASVGTYVAEVFSVGFSMTVHGPDEFYEVTLQQLPRKVALADFVVCISHFARSQLMKVSPYEHWSKLVVARLGVDTDVFHPTMRESTGSPFEILCVGRLTSAKGQHLLVDAAARLVADGRDVVVHLIGDGVDRPSLEQHIRELGLEGRVVLVGAIDQDEIRFWYGRSDCFCIPSFAEGIPVVLMEAMAMELPCVTTHITGIPELITNGIDGLLVAPSDIDGLVASIERLVDDPEFARDLGRRGRERVRAAYDLAVNVGELAAVFDARLGQRGTASSVQV